jgi:hypothetical protein
MEDAFISILSQAAPLRGRHAEGVPKPPKTFAEP